MKIWTDGPHRVSYTEVGSGRPLVLLHAFPQNREQWAPQIEGLATHVRVIAPDLFGFGGTPIPPGGWTIDSAADMVAEFLKGIGVAEPVVLGGLSMGGYVALAFARRHTAHLCGLILADTQSGADSAEGKANRDHAIAFVTANGAAAQVAAMLPKVLGPTTHATRPAVIAEVRRIGDAQSVAGICAALVALRDRPDATPGLATIAVPTLVIVGTEDGITPPAVAEKLAASIPGAKLVTLPAVGHLSNVEDPAAFNGAMKAFLDSLP